jgi:hypothetical protein
MQTSITNDYVRTECAYKASNLIDAVNSRYLIIEDNETMLAVLNELWFRKGKASMRQVLLKTKGDNGSSYPHSIIDDAIDGSRIILTPEGTFSVVSNDSKHFPICPVRVHNSPHKGGVRINVFTSPKMTRFGFVVNSFKQSCKNQHLYDVKMNMDETFVAHVIREKLEDRFSRLNKPEFVIYEAIREEQLNNTEFDGFIDEPVSEINWLAVENPVSLLNTNRIGYLYANTKTMVAFRTTGGDIVLINISADDDGVPVGYVAKSVGPFRELNLGGKKKIEHHKFDAVLKIITEKDGQEE